jgi:hypothetical protein
MSEPSLLLNIFCRTIRARSEEHKKALYLVYDAGLFGQVIAILRQELDSFIRVLYLLSIPDRSSREELIRQTLEGKKWTDERGNLIHDAQMVNHANKLGGWEKNAYRFGCSFIHLSNLHDYQERDPLSTISSDDKESILSYMRSYHGGPTELNPKLKDVIPYLPKVFDKIADNLEYYTWILEERPRPSHS